MHQPPPDPSHREYIQMLRRMTPEQRLAKAFEMTAFAKQLFLDGLRQRHPELSEEQLRHLYMERLAKCHNRNW